MAGAVNQTITGFVSVVLTSLLVFPTPWTPLLAQVENRPKLQIVILGDEGAINNIKQRTAREIVVQVEDENHKPVGGAVVSAVVLPSRGASGVFVGGSPSLTIPVGADGKASFFLQPNGVAGKFGIRVTASFSGQTVTTTIAQVNAVVAAGATAGTVAGVGISAKVIAIIAVVGAAAAGGVVAATRSGSNGNNNGTTGPSATTVSAGGTRVGAP